MTGRKAARRETGAAERETAPPEAGGANEPGAERDTAAPGGAERDTAAPGGAERGAGEMGGTAGMERGMETGGCSAKKMERREEIKANFDTKVERAAPAEAAPDTVKSRSADRDGAEPEPNAAQPGEGAAEAKPNAAEAGGGRADTGAEPAPSESVIGRKRVDGADGRMYLRLLGAPRRLRAGRLELRVLTAFEMLQARAEAALTADGDEAAFGLWLNAAVLARAVHVRGRRPFRSAVDAAGTLSPAQIETLTESYELLCKRDNLSPCADAQTHEELLRQLAGRPYERLKWRVLRAFSTLPSSRAARAMTDADYLYCALHTVLDGREYRASLCPGCRERLNRPVCPGCGAELSEEMVNASFDEAAFERRRRGIC